MPEDVRQQLWLIYSQLKDAESDPEQRLNLLQQSREELGRVINRLNQQAEPGLYAAMAEAGAKGGAARTSAKAAAARANGAKGGRPRKPNLFIKFAKAVWQEPDPNLLNKLYVLVGDNTWLPDEQGEERTGPYVRVYVPQVTSALEKLLTNSMNVFEWDTKPFLRLCKEHKNDLCKEMTEAERLKASSCGTCGEPADWIY